MKADPGDPGCKCHEAVKDEINRFLFNARKNAGKLKELLAVLRQMGYETSKASGNRYELVGQNHLHSGHQIRVRFSSNKGLVGDCLTGTDHPIAAA